MARMAGTAGMACTARRHPFMPCHAYMLGMAWHGVAWQGRAGQYRAGEGRAGQGGAQHGMQGMLG
eukprot:15466531-Alexandrium_andersonii.AAC.1